MKNKRRKIILILISAALFAGPTMILAKMDSSNYQIWADTISEGGTENSASANYELDETAGEGAIGRASSTNYSSRAGFREMQKENSLTFSVGSASVNLGELSRTVTKEGSHTLTIQTNSSSGVSATFSGSTLACATCSGSNSITAVGAVATPSAAGTSQFGFNVILSSGSSPVASASSPYNAAGSYAFSSGNQIVSSSGAINATVFNVNYIANMSGVESTGSYSTTITFTATANF
ncbi:MAG: hypothetical protein AAB791_00280 [Patescibacteria group bacterium]